MRNYTALLASAIRANTDAACTIYHQVSACTQAYDAAQSYHIWLHLISYASWRLCSHNGAAVIAPAEWHIVSVAAYLSGRHAVQDMGTHLVSKSHMLQLQHVLT